MYSSNLFCILVFNFIILFVNGQNTDNSYTPEEKKAIQELRKLTGTVKPDYLNEDFVLLNFLRDKNMNVNEAHKNLKQSVEWRVKNNIDKIHDEKILPDLFPYRLEGHDKSGRPIFYISPPKWDVRTIISNGHRDQLIRLWAKYLDEAMHKILETRNTTGQDIRTGVLILDVDGYNLRQHACLRCFSTFFEWDRLYERNYPQTLEHMFFINTPRIFTPLLGLLRGVFSPHTRKVLKVFGPNKEEWRKEILTIIDENELLKYYGGKKEPKTITENQN